MIPSNPDNQQPLIYRICDAAGVYHLVAPVNHTHSQDEIPGLAAVLASKANYIPVAAGYPNDAIVIVTALGGILRSDKTLTEILNEIAAKQNALTFDTIPTANSTNPVTSGGVKAALDGKTEISRGNKGWFQVTANGQVQVIGEQSVVIGISDIEAAVITLDNIANLNRALEIPDSTPTVDSGKLVTSGGVKAALDELEAHITDLKTYSSSASSKPLIEDIFGGQNIKKVDVFIINSTGEESTLRNLFDLTQEQNLMIPENAPTIPNSKGVLIHLYRGETQLHFILELGNIYSV